MIFAKSTTQLSPPLIATDDGSFVVLSRVGTLEYSFISTNTSPTLLDVDTESSWEIVSYSRDIREFHVPPIPPYKGKTSQVSTGQLAPEKASENPSSSSSTSPTPKGTHTTTAASSTQKIAAKNFPAEKPTSWLPNRGPIANSAFRPPPFLGQRIIMSGTWLAETLSAPALQHAENLITANAPQRAFIALDEHLASPNLLLSSRLNATLLKSCTLRFCSDPKRALALAEEVLFRADRVGMYDLVAKAQLYRGLALLDMGFPAEAKTCFMRGASVRWFARDVGYWMDLAEGMRLELPPEHARRELGEGFQTVPVPEGLTAFGS